MEMSRFVQREVEQVQKVTLPLMKKAGRFFLFSVPLLGISIANLVALLFFIPGGRAASFLLLLYAAVGAFGMALLKEARLHNREVQQAAVDYMIRRIEQSSVIAEGRKNEYIHSIMARPVGAMAQFIRFLAEEERLIQ